MKLSITPLTLKTIILGLILEKFAENMKLWNVLYEYCDSDLLHVCLKDMKINCCKKDYKFCNKNCPHFAKKNIEFR